MFFLIIFCVLSVYSILINKILGYIPVDLYFFFKKIKKPDYI
ncbi:putative membrane protein [Piscirickettsia salmonis LF-89 = ATCC VR-1361]|nr:putative membrane protein [Piscirickettsia salmonis LF-89 = ATCC VR-1361]